MKWNNLTPEQQEEIVLNYEEDPSYTTIAAYAIQYDMPVSTLQRRCQERIAARDSSDQPVQTVFDTSPPTLTNLRNIDPYTDQGRWLDNLYELRETDRFIRVMHGCDFHFPYHHTGATELFYDLVESFQPHLIATGSDSADFATISKFGRSGDEEDVDVLEEFDNYYTPHTHEIAKRAPYSRQFFILGNHEKRIYDFILRQAPQVRKTVWNHFLEIVRCGGLVDWLGETDFARIGPLIVEHGNRTTANPAKSMLEDTGYQVSIMAGHVHRKSQWERRGEDFSVVGVTSGCHCVYPPHYAQRTRLTSQWHMGTALAEVDLQSRQVSIENLTYFSNPDRIWVNFRGEHFEAENPIPQGLITYEEYKNGL